MRFEQAGSILRNQVSDYHNALSVLYHTFAAAGVSPRVRLMLEYLADSEARLVSAIHEFLADTGGAAADRWLGRAEKTLSEPDPSLLSEDCRSDLDALVGVAVRYKTDLIKYFDHLIELSEREESAHLFRTIRAQEEKGMKRLIRHSQGLADL